MNRSFIITEEDKNRILGMHENATKRQYLNETNIGIVEANDEGGLDTYQNKQLNTTTNSSSKQAWEPKLENCVKSSGGRKDEQGVYWITNTEGKWGYYSDGRYHKEGSNNWGYYYCNGNKIGYSKTPVKPGLTPQFWKPELENCIKSSGGRKDENGIYWVANTEGKWGYYSDGRYHKEGSNNWGYYYCNGNKIAYSRTPVKPGENPTPTQTTPTQTNYKIPSQLSNKEGVIKFQTWMETNHKGWYKGSGNPIDGKFGKQTNAAWTKYGSEYMLKNPNKEQKISPVSTPNNQNVGPLAPTPGPQQPTSLSFPQ